MLICVMSPFGFALVFMFLFSAKTQLPTMPCWPVQTRMRETSASLLVQINVYVTTQRGHPDISLVFAVFLLANTV